MRFVRKMKPYGSIAVKAAMVEIGYWWPYPKRIPKNIEKMTEGIPRCRLEQILAVLRRNESKNLTTKRGLASILSVLKRVPGR